MLNRFARKESMASKDGLRIIPLGGMGDVTKNMYVYDCQGDIIVVDCGVGFPEGDLLGVDVVIPDVTFLKKNQDRIRAFFITHGHNDHYSALPYILPQFDRTIPVYASRLVVGLIKNSLKEFGLLSSTDIREYNPEGASVKAGVFELLPFRVNHSVPDAAAFVINTPVGRIVHVSDFKFDWTPVDGRIFDIRRLCSAIEGGVDGLLSDCLGSHHPGYTSSEKDIEKSFDLLLDDAQGQVFITMTSSNISRIQQAINSSVRHGRKVALLGRSVRDNVTIARELGYIAIPDGVIVDPRRAAKLPVSKITYIVAGTYGQKGSALRRIAEGDSAFVTLQAGAQVVFSGDPSPSGVKDSVDRVVDKLTTLGAEVHDYEIQENLHVSGHGSQGDILMLASIVRPNFFIPIGGTASTMRGYTRLMTKAGFDPKSVYELSNGDVLELRNGMTRVVEKIRVSDVYVDGSGVGDVGKQVIDERSLLSESGVLVIAAALSKDSRSVIGDIEVTSRGFVFERNAAELMKRVRELSRTMFGELLGKTTLSKARREIEVAVAQLVYKETEREPIVLVMATVI